MQYLKKYYIFNKLFKYNFNLYYNKLIIYMNYKYYIIKIPSIFYFKQMDKNYSFIFLKKFYYITFLHHLFNFYNTFFCYYYYVLKLKGLGYRVFQLSKKLLKIFLNRSNFFYLHVPNSILLKYRTRRFFFIGTQYTQLKVLILRLLLLKEFIVYRVNGIYYTRQLFIIKPGKNKFR